MASDHSQKVETPPLFTGNAGFPRPWTGASGRTLAGLYGLRGEGPRDPSSGAGTPILAVLPPRGLRLNSRKIGVIIPWSGASHLAPGRRATSAPVPLRSQADFCLSIRCRTPAPLAFLIPPFKPCRSPISPFSQGGPYAGLVHQQLG